MYSFSVGNLGENVAEELGFVVVSQSSRKNKKLMVAQHFVVVLVLLPLEVDP